jgi:MFS superfamily sulfate permease-like transporter
MSLNTNNALSLFKGLKQHWKADAISGFLVFLIALPLCLGISKASGFPPIAGIYTAIIGGIVVSFISGSHLTIKGPAAGLIVIALGCIEELEAAFPGHGYKMALGVVVVCGLLQVVAGVLKTGLIVDLMPSAAIHGMLASIGIIIASKQIHIALGVNPQSKEPLALLAEIPHSITHMNPELALIGGISILILFILPKIRHRYARLLPGPLLVILFAIPMSLLLDLSHPHESFNAHSIKPEEVLVRLPESFVAGITTPDFSQVLHPISLKYIIMFLLVGSIEALLATKAIDSLDPMKRKSNLNKDLVGIGVGNTLAGMVGGLPMICEIVRSSANINNGGRTQWSNFFHGVFLLSALLFLVPVIQLIPNAALAAMLIFTGYRLASPDEFKKTFKIGPDQLLIFVSTIVVTIATDLLVGIAFGILIKSLQHIFFGAPVASMFRTNMLTEQTGDHKYTVRLKDTAVFTNFLGFKKRFDKIPKDAQVVLDMSDAIMVDHTFMEHLHDFENDFGHHGGQLTIQGLEGLTPYSQHPLSARKLINNAIFAPTRLVYDHRQKILAAFAQQKGLVFDHKRTTSILRFRFAPFTIAKRAAYGENILMGNAEYCNYFFTDIYVEEGALMTKQEYKMTILLVTDIHAPIPVFSIEKAGAFDLIKEIGGHKDINFDAYPEFSNEYYLTGEDEQQVRAFFGEPLIRLFERQKGFCVECRNNVLLIYRQIDTMEPEELQHTLNFLEAFMAVVHQKSEPAVLQKA